MSCANPQHHNGCRCDLNFQDQSRTYELDKTVAELRRREVAYITRTGELSRACGLLLGALEAATLGSQLPHDLTPMNLKKILSEAQELLGKK